MYIFPKLSEGNFLNKKILLRVDLNVPIYNASIMDDSRIRAIIPTIEYLLQAQSRNITIISHLGRPRGVVNKSMSLSLIKDKLQEILKTEIEFIENYLEQEIENRIKSSKSKIILLENLRFHKEENNNNISFAKKLSSFCDIYVNDAFSCCHRNHSSMVSIPKFLKSYAGLLLEKEIDSLNSFNNYFNNNTMVVIGGSKISSKIELLKFLAKKFGAIFIAGGIANNFFKFQNKNIGNSFYEEKYLDCVGEILDIANSYKCKIILPVDVFVTDKLKEPSFCKILNIDSVKDEDIIADIGPNTLNLLCKELLNYNAVVWNGPIGVSEVKPFDTGTNFLASFISYLTNKDKIISIAGGGDIMSSLEKAKLTKEFSYISTAGGAFLQWLEGKNLIGIQALSYIKSQS